MTGFYCFVFYLTFITICKEISSLPFLETNDEHPGIIIDLPYDNQKNVTVQQPDPIRTPLHMFIPKTEYSRHRRDESRAEGEQSGGSGVQEFITTAIKDGIAASSAMDSPTMFIGGFSVMMQPMPNGTEFAGQLMQMAPHYMSLLPALPTGGRK